MFGATLRCKVCNQYAPDRCACFKPHDMGPRGTPEGVVYAEKNIAQWLKEQSEKESNHG